MDPLPTCLCTVHSLHMCMLKQESDTTMQALKHANDVVDRYRLWIATAATVDGVSCTQYAFPHLHAAYTQALNDALACVDLALAAHRSYRVHARVRHGIEVDP